MKTILSTCHSLEGPRLHTSQNQKCAPARSNKVRRSLPQKNYQNTQNNAPKRYAHTVGNRCDSAKCCVAAVYTYKYNINTILSRAIQQRYSQFEGLGKKGRITWPHGGTHLQNEAGAFHAPSVEPDPDPLHKQGPSMREHHLRQCPDTFARDWLVQDSAVFCAWMIVEQSRLYRIDSTLIGHFFITPHTHRPRYAIAIVADALASNKNENNEMDNP